MRLFAVIVFLAFLAPSAAAVGPTRKKSMWGPVRVAGESQFPRYRELGVGLYQTTVSWSEIARRRPAAARDPGDRAYRWPAEIDDALAEADRHGIEVSLLVMGSPPWANGGRSSRWAPTRPDDFADFLEAAARRYPAVKHWMIWGEPTKAKNFQPLTSDQGRPLRGRGLRGPRTYARLLDAAYVRLKRVDPANLVIGGNTYTVGDVRPRNFIRALRLPNGRRPRMDLFGHNPFTARRPRLASPPLGDGYADFSDLDTLAGWLDRSFPGQRLRLFLSEFTLPTDRPNREFNFHVTRRLQAEWISAALRIVRRTRRIYTFGYLGLYDERPNRRGDEVRRGLIDARGRRKPAYDAFRRG